MIASLLLVAALAAQPAAGPRRFAFAVGENQGDPGDEPLRFAEVDARRTMDALLEVGGVLPGDGAVLLGATAARLSEALRLLEARLAREARPGDQLVVYVSSHADEGELHLAGTRFPVRELSDFVKRASVGVALLVLDSCRSGAVTRLKGLKPLGTTAVSVDAPEVLGRVLISSSGADEYSQESETLRGSYFTHHLISALRGAADLSHDGRVTLQEAYAYAYAHTVESTFATRAGVQHPSYHVDLKGQDDLVLSEPAKAVGRLSIQVADPGEWLVAAEGGELVGQFEKARGPTLFALPPGEYRVRLRTEGGHREARVRVVEGSEAVVHAEQLSFVAAPAASRKGGEVSGWTAGIDFGQGTGAVKDLPWMNEIDVSLARGGALGLGPLDLFTLGFAHRTGQSRGEQWQIYKERELELRVGLGHGWQWGFLGARAALELGGLWVTQWGLPGLDRVGIEPLVAISGALQAKLAGPVSFLLLAREGAELLRTDQGLRYFLLSSWGLGLAIDL